MNKNKENINQLKNKLKDIAHLSASLGLLYWDQDVYLPVKAVNQRAMTIAHLNGLIHHDFLNLNTDGLLDNLRNNIDSKEISELDQAIIRETGRTYDRLKKLPEHFVKELSETTSKAVSVWTEARKKSDFKIFLPVLKKIITLKRQEAELVGYADSPYDALLDTFEPNMTTGEASIILNDLKDFLVPFIKQVLKSNKNNKIKQIKGEYQISQQEKFNMFVAKKIGFDFEAGRLDVSAHPFTTGFHAQDVRITTRYDKNNIFYALFSTIHEVGHAIYGQGLPIEHFGLPLAESISLGIEESQSRLWENMIGKNINFWKYFYPKLVKEFPKSLNKISLAEFYKIINTVKPSLIRTEADEVTYNLHIIVRFEIEKEMIEGSIELKDLPEIWNSKMQQYLGIKVPDDRRGVLQDIHWSLGCIGYFPTYSFGNIYSAQLYNTMEKDILNLDKEMRLGHFEHIKNWLNINVHRHGKFYTADGLIRNITGEGLNSKYFIEYLKDKFA